MPRSILADAVPVQMGRLFVTQSALLLASATVALLTLQAGLPYVGQSLIAGLVGMVLLTVVVGVATWDARWAGRALVALPLIDLVLVGLMRAAAPSSGFGFVLLLPLAWMALNLSRRGAVIGTALVVVLSWGPLVLDRLDLRLLPALEVVGTPTAAASASLSVVAAVVALVISSTAERFAAQGRLLDTQAKRAQSSYRQARRDERVLNAVMDAVPFGVVSLDADHTFRGSNRAARAMTRHLGLPLGTPLDQLPIYHLDGTTPVECDDLPYVRALAGQAVEAETYWIGHPGGRRIAIEVSARIVTDDAGGLDRLVVVFRDVGGSIEAEAARDQAIASISHEFRTPLSAILGFIELAADTPDLPREAAQHLAVAERNTTRLLTLVADLLATRGRTIESTLPLTLGPVDLAAILDDAVTALRPLMNDRLLTLTLDAVPTAPVLGDGFRLRQVLDNLLHNAVKYNVDGGSIAVDLAVDGDVVRVSITDTGVGLSPREREEVFEPYLRGADARAGTVPGSGLGLAISRGIVEQHDGTVRLDAGDMGGTTAVLELPRRTEER